MDSYPTPCMLVQTMPFDVLQTGMVLFYTVSTPLIMHNIVLISVATLALPSNTTDQAVVNEIN
jgi:hypothetical protein